LSAVPVEVRPPELANLVDFAERSRVDDWSLRSALCRYAQPEPVRVGQVLESLRRIEAALHGHAKLFEREGAALWAAVRGDGPAGDGWPPEVVGLLQATALLDGLGERLAAWAVDRAGERPNAEVDDVVAEVTRRLDDLGIPREEREGPPRRGRRPGATE
jgi:hypothetical protein